KEIKINLREEAKDWIIRKTCHNRSYGARPLRRAIQRYIEDSVAELIIQGKLKENQTLTIYLEDDALFYRPKGSQKQGAPLSYGLA
ncbi:MAG: ATP-dependent Clp protease ATP-binding subunit ClpC, partial [Acidobacteria bacterium]|nr:ATP-dependent Clp protease ATP-binding subunit ClpC [Acidobacteriota bacterium]